MSNNFFLFLHIKNKPYHCGKIFIFIEQGKEVNIYNIHITHVMYKCEHIQFPSYRYDNYTLTVPDHDGGRPKQINAWFLYTHMVYL